MNTMRSKAVMSEIVFKLLPDEALRKNPVDCLIDETVM